MAVRDVREYYNKMYDQLIEMKNDLEDFEQALKDGHITEAQVQAAKDEIIPLQLNIDRITYIMYLLELPNRKAKQPKCNKQNKKILAELHNRNADLESVIEENRSALDRFRAELKKLKDE